jgi:membrane associated rhomboid family serine protease
LVTRIFVGLNVSVFLLQVASGVSATNPTSEDLLRFGADFGYAVLVHHEWWRVLTSTFVHIGILHLLVNMYSLWQVGQFVERLFGPFVFAGIYVASGLAGSFASIAWNPMSISAGASGAIFGVFGAILGFVIRARNRLPAPALASIRSSIAMTLLYNLVFALTSPFLDHAAHLGGLLVGAIGGVLATSSVFRHDDRRARTASLLPLLVVLAALVAVAVKRGLSSPVLQKAQERESRPGRL